MPATLIDGAKIAAEIRKEIAAEVRSLAERSITPGLAFVIVGENPASQVYVRMKGKACDEVGFVSRTDLLSEDTTEAELLGLLGQLNADPKFHGILVQLPLPDHIDASRIIEAIKPVKDVDGFHPMNVGKLVVGQETMLPCTPAGIQELLTRSGHDPDGKHVVVVGRSNIVGKPIANMLLQKKSGGNAVVTVVHTGAKDVYEQLPRADIVIAAVGRPEFIRGEHLKKGSVIIDVGINRVDDPSKKSGYRIVGDVHFESASAVAGAITPVPGGVGPMTIAMLLKNTLKACTKTLP